MQFSANPGRTKVHKVLNLSSMLKLLMNDDLGNVRLLFGSARPQFTERGPGVCLKIIAGVAVYVLTSDSI